MCMSEKAREIARSLPDNPGCYLMKNKEGTVIYVGKAKNLKRRVSSYFLPNRNAKTAALVEKIDDIEFVITGNEYEALVLENNLIKKYTPHYNILLKDGKSYPVIRITNEDFPHIFKTRRVIKDGSKYFGPYPDLTRLDTYLKMVEDNYPLRHCQGPLKMRKTPCLYYHIHRCSGPCIGAIDKKDYMAYVREVEDFLSGDDSSLIKQVEKEMNRAAKELDFETAARKRDQLKALTVMQKNQMVEDFSADSRDYAAIEMRSYLCTISLMQFRSGRLIGRALYRAECLSDETETLLSFLIQYYSDGDSLPGEIFVSCEIDTELLSSYFRNELHSGVYVTVPKDGKHYRILRMAAENASRDVEKRLREVDNTPALEKLRDELERHFQSGRIAAVIYSNPNNPAWFCLTEDELKILAEMAEKYDVIIIEDLAYFAMDFRKDLGRPFEPPYQASVGRYTDNYILQISGSKAFSYAGQRIGITAISDKLYHRAYPGLTERYGGGTFGTVYIHRVLYALSSGTSHSAQYALAAMFKAASDGKFDFVSTIKEYGRRAARLKKIFTDHGFKIVYDHDLDQPIADGFYFTIAYPGMTGGELMKELITGTEEALKEN